MEFVFFNVQNLLENVVLVFCFCLPISYCCSSAKIALSAPYILGLLVSVPLLFCELGLSHVDRVVTLNIDKNANHSRFIVEKHVVDDIIFYVYFPKIGYQVDSVYTGCYKGWIKNFDLISDFCYALVNYDYVHKDGLFYEIKVATRSYSPILRQLVSHCPTLKDHILRASIALKYIRETHFYTDRSQPSFVTEADYTNYVEPQGFVSEANSLDISDLALKGNHFRAVSEFIDVYNTTIPRSSRSQGESHQGEFGQFDIPQDGSSVPSYDANQDILLTTPNYDIIISEEPYQTNRSAPENGREESTRSRPPSPTLPPIPEQAEPEDSTTSLPNDLSISLDQQETSTTEATTEQTESEHVELDNQVIQFLQELNNSVETLNESVGSEDAVSTVHLDSERENENSTSLAPPHSTPEVASESVSEDSTSSVTIDTRGTVSEDSVQSPESQSSDPIVTVENQGTDSSGLIEQNNSTDQDGSPESPSDEPSSSVLSDSSEQLESPENSSQATTLLTETESNTVISDPEPNEPTESEDSTQPVHETSTDEAEGQQASSEDTTSQAHANQSADAVAEPSESEQPTSDQQDQQDDVFVQEEYDDTVGLHSSSTNITVLHSSVNAHNPIERHITFSDGVTLTYGFFIKHNTPMRTPLDTSLFQSPESYVGSTSQAGEADDDPYTSTDFFDVPLFLDSDDDDYDQYLTDGVGTSLESAFSFQFHSSTTEATVEHTVTTETTSLAQEEPSTDQLDPTSDNVQSERTQYEDSTLSTDQQHDTHQQDSSEVISEDSDKSLEKEDTELSQTSDYGAEESTESVDPSLSTVNIESEPTSSGESTLTTNLRAAETSGTDSLQLDQSHLTDGEMTEIHSEQHEDESEISLSSTDQHSFPDWDCNSCF